MPARPEDIARFEKDNAHLNLRINLICVEDKEVYPLYCSRVHRQQEQLQQQELQIAAADEDDDNGDNDEPSCSSSVTHTRVTASTAPILINHVTLVLYLLPEVDGGDSQLAVNHYAYVEDINLFLQQRYSTENPNHYAANDDDDDDDEEDDDHDDDTYWNTANKKRQKRRKKKKNAKKRYSYQKGIRCANCFVKFANRDPDKRREALASHYERCLRNETQAVELPRKGEEASILQFKNHVNKFPAYFWGAFDFEAVQVKPPPREGGEGRTTVMAEQKPIMCSYVILDGEGLVATKGTCIGYDCVKQFISHLISIEPMLMKTLTRNEVFIETDESRRAFREATHCHICNQPLTSPNVGCGRRDKSSSSSGGSKGDQRVRDHCHISGIAIFKPCASYTINQKFLPLILTGRFLGIAHSRCNILRVERRRIYLFCHNLSG